MKFLLQESFLDRVASVLPVDLDPDQLLDRPACFPVFLSTTNKISKGKCLLIGEAAHCCHPVGGQGMNLCWRDVNELMNL